MAVFATKTKVDAQVQARQTRRGLGQVCRAHPSPRPAGAASREHWPGPHPASSWNLLTPREEKKRDQELGKTKYQKEIRFLSRKGLKFFGGEISFSTTVLD